MINLDEMVDKMTKAKVEKQAQETRNPADDTFMSFKPEHTYLGRLLPNVANPANTFTPYEEYGFVPLMWFARFLLVHFKIACDCNRVIHLAL